MVFTLLAVLCLHLYLSWQVRDLSDIDGRKEILSAGADVVAAVDVYEIISKAQKQQKTVRVSERNLNFYIAQKLSGEQGGLLGSVSTIRGVWVDLQPDSIEMIIERHVDLRDVVKTLKGDVQIDFEGAPFDHTVSMLLKVVSGDAEEGHRITSQIKSGRFGQSPAPGYYAKLVQQSFEQILAVFQPELEVGYKNMVELRVLDGEIEFNPVREVITVARRKGE